MEKQPPSGGCVLKRTEPFASKSELKQPPSGGCVLKLKMRMATQREHLAATFGWLCVETFINSIRGKTNGSSHLRVAVC